jgi:hypothetical protein
MERQTDGRVQFRFGTMLGGDDICGKLAENAAIFSGDESILETARAMAAYTMCIGVTNSGVPTHFRRP